MKENGSITFWMEKEMPVLDVTEENYVLSKARNGFWRVTLSAPEIGFGSELYRQLLTQVMINNSRKPQRYGTFTGRADCADDERYGVGV